MHFKGLYIRNAVREACDGRLNPDAMHFLLGLHRFRPCVAISPAFPA